MVAGQGKRGEKGPEAYFIRYQSGSGAVAGAAGCWMPAVLDLLPPARRASLAAQPQLFLPKTASDKAERARPGHGEGCGKSGEQLCLHGGGFAGTP